MVAPAPSPAPFKAARLWPHLLALATGLYLFQAFHFGPAWGVREFAGVVLVWGCTVLLLDARLRRDLRKREPRFRDGPVLAAAGLLLLALLGARVLAASQVAVAVSGACVGLLVRRPYFQLIRLHRPVHHLDRCVLLLVAGFFLIGPYVTPQLVGSGDAQHYARQLADFMEQLRQGEFPIFVGQSRFAFGGDVHPLRLAPYFQYAGGLLDIVTGRSLSPYAVQNLLVVLSFLAALFGCYWSLAYTAGRNRHWACVWLALLFASSPGVLALLYGGDMIASWMTLPWLPLLFHGWVRAWRDADDRRGLAVQAVALALMWLAHAPIALWASILTLVSELVRRALRPRDWRGLWRQAGAAGLCVLLCHYVFVSVITLQVPDNPYLTFAMTHGLVMDVLRDGWTGFFRIVTGHPDRLLQDLHLSPGLWIAGLVGVAGLCARATRGLAAVMLAALATSTVLLIPLSGVTDRFWNHLPGFVLTVTEKWPMQRFYPIMSALAVTLAAAGLAHPWFGRRHVYRGVVTVLAIGALWSGWEARKFVRHGRSVTHSADLTQRYLLPENNRLSKYSYEMWGRLPQNFSFAHMNPEMQNRLLDGPAQRMLESNMRHILQHAPPPPAVPVHRFVPDATGGSFYPRIGLAPGESTLLRFSFLERDPRGTLLVQGRRVHRTYQLPSSGAENAFGTGPDQNRAIALTNFGDAPEEIDVRFIRSDSAAPQGRFADLDVVPYDPATLPVRLQRLVPYELSVQVGDEKWLKTPKLLVPGYVATIDGRPVTPSRSPDGLLMLPVTRGQHLVSIRYEGPPALRWSFWLNFLSLAAGAGGLLMYLAGPPRRRRQVQSVWFGRSLEALGGAVAVAAVVWVAGRGISPWPAAVTEPAPGRISLTVKFPVGKHEVYEPLLTMTDPEGNTTSVVVFYESDHSVRIGCRKNGVLKILTDSLQTNYFLAQKIEMQLGPLLRDDDRLGFPGLSDGAWSELRQQLKVQFNHYVVWETDLGHQAPAGLIFAVGFDASTAGKAAQKFRGQIVEAAGLPFPAAGDSLAATQQ